MVDIGAIKLAPTRVSRVSTVFFHIIGSSEWANAEAAGRYEPDSLSSEGFIHLSLREQIARPANLLYRGRSDLVLLVVDGDALVPEVVMEPGSHGESELFPHLYGPLNLDAVLEVVGFPPNADGTFGVPDQLPD